MQFSTALRVVHATCNEKRATGGMSQHGENRPGNAAMSAYLAMSSRSFGRDKSSATGQASTMHKDGREAWPATMSKDKIGKQASFSGYRTQCNTCQQPGGSFLYSWGRAWSPAGAQYTCSPLPCNASSKCSLRKFAALNSLFSMRM